MTKHNKVDDTKAIRAGLPVEHSYGIIPIRTKNNIIQVLMVHQTNGYWDFPKGHPTDEHEDNRATAVRELEEETGLRVAQFLDLQPLHTQYAFKLHGKEIEKHVTLYIARVRGRITLPQPEEVIDARWVTLNEAKKLVYFVSAQQLISELEHALKNVSNTIVLKKL